MISCDEKEFLLTWIKTIEDRFIPNPVSPHRKFYMFTNHESCPYLLWDIKQRIIEKENLQSCHSEPFIGDYVGWISNGGAIHIHRDPGAIGSDGKKLRHVRYNLFLSVPDEGGVGIYDGELKYPKEGEYLICESSEYDHGCTEVVGSKPRIILSYGFLEP